MVSTDGPVSKVKPSCTRWPDRPPGNDSRSTTVTWWPCPVRWQAAARPASPAPITTMSLIVPPVIRSPLLMCPTTLREVGR